MQRVRYVKWLVNLDHRCQRVAVSACGRVVRRVIWTVYPCQTLVDDSGPS